MSAIGASLLGMSDDLVFYTNPMSRGRIVHWMLEEVGATYRVELRDFKRAEHKRAEFLAINPMGKLPTLVHRGVVITETIAICMYLADEFPAAGLAPKIGDPLRGTYLRWLLFAASCVEPAMLDRSLDRLRPDRASAVGYGSYEDLLATLLGVIQGGTFVLGERFSTVDLVLGSQIGWGLRTGGFDANPVLAAYAERVIARPAFARAAAQGAELAARLEAASA